MPVVPILAHKYLCLVCIHNMDELHQHTLVVDSYIPLPPEYHARRRYEHQAIVGTNL
jgi:hypothetical protein